MSDDKEVRVLLADDSLVIRKNVEKLVQEIGYTVIGTAQNGSEAVELEKSNNPDLILLDINMPIKTGIEALEEIIENNPDALVIMMTSVSDAEVVEKCMDLGAANYIVKDSSPGEIMDTIRDTYEMNALD